MGKLSSLDTFMREISTGLDAEVAEGPGGKDNLMKVRKRKVVVARGERLLGLSTLHDVEWS